MNFVNDVTTWFSTNWDMFLANLSSFELSATAFADAFVKDVPSLLIVFLLTILAASVHLLGRYTKSLKATIHSLEKVVSDLKSKTNSL